MISALHAVPDMLSTSPGLAPGYPSEAVSKRFQDMVQPTPPENDAQADEPGVLKMDAQAQALDTQVLSGLVRASGLNQTDPESDDE